MPELPEVETVREELAEFLVGKEITKFKSPSDKSLRKPVEWPGNRLKVSQVNRWGKKLLIDLDNRAHFDVSLGMTGSFRKQDKYLFKDHDHVLLKLSDGSNLIFNDPRRFGWIQYKTNPPKLSGWDPILSPIEGRDKVIKSMKVSKKDLYSFLMDQKHIVGLGNIYVQEALFRAGAYPFRRCNKTSYKVLNLILDKSVEVLKEALEFKGTTIINYKSAKGNSGGFQSRLKVYGKSDKDSCQTCSSPLKRVQKARGITYCRLCQK